MNKNLVWKKKRKKKPSVAKLCQTGQGKPSVTDQEVRRETAHGSHTGCRANYACREWALL